MTRIICGVDISSASLAARIGRDGATGSFPNTAEGIVALASFCHAHVVELVAMEATGGYEQQPFALLWEQGLPVTILNPRAVRRFAEGMGLLEKTDSLDAGVIAWFAEVKRSQPQSLSSASRQQLRALVTRLCQLTAIRTAQRNQSRLVTASAVLASFTELLALVARQIRELEIAIAALITEDPLWHQLDQVFRSIKGVADRTVARLMAEMPEIGTLSNKAISKLAGVAPLARDSGKQQGKRAVRGRPPPGARNPLRGSWRSRPLRTRLHRLPAAPPRRRQTRQGHPHRTGSQTTGSPQRQGPRSASAHGNRDARSTGSYRGDKLNTVSSSSSRGCGKAENDEAFSEAARRRLFHNPLHS